MTTPETHSITSLIKNRLLFLIACLSACVSCNRKHEVVYHPDEPIASNYYGMNFIPDHPRPGLTLIHLNSYQQTTEYTCGPACVVTILNFYGRQEDEMTIAAEMGTSTSCGTSPEQMTDWLNHNGFDSFNAQRFYYMWYDALLFGKVMRRVFILATPLTAN